MGRKENAALDALDSARMWNQVSVRAIQRRSLRQELGGIETVIRNGLCGAEEEEEKRNAFVTE